MQKTTIGALIVGVLVLGFLGYKQFSGGQIGSAASSTPSTYGLTLCQNGSCSKVNNLALQCQSAGSSTQCGLIFSITQK